MGKETLTPLGYYLSQKPLSQAKISRMTGISKDRMSDLYIKAKTRPTVEEIYLISLAISVHYSEIVDFLCKGLELKPKGEWN